MSNRKRNPLIEELMNNIPEETKRRVEKYSTCKWLINGNECSNAIQKKASKGMCDPDRCASWEHYKDDEK